MLTLLWYLALNFIIIYVLVYLNEREVAAHREVTELQGDLKELAVVEERNRLAREIHDGLGASLSSLIIQSEYLLSLAPKDEPLLKEIRELKASAEESIEELRRKLSRLGSVNLEALTELQELETRAATLQTQLDDLIAAKKSLEEIIQRINQKGVPILLVEQNARQALNIAHRGYVIVTGRNQITGSGADLLASDEVRQAYLGE